MRRNIGSICILALALLLSGCAVEAQQLTSPNPELKHRRPLRSLWRGIMADNTSEEIHINQLGYRARRYQDREGIRNSIRSFLCWTVRYGAGRLRRDIRRSQTRTGARERTWCAGIFPRFSSPGRVRGAGAGPRDTVTHSVSRRMYTRGLAHGGTENALLPALRVGPDRRVRGRVESPGLSHLPVKGRYTALTGIDHSTGAAAGTTRGIMVNTRSPRPGPWPILLLAYTLYPEAYRRRYPYPRKRKRYAPDILDEARVGVEWLLKMQDPNIRRGVP